MLASKSNGISISAAQSGEKFARFGTQNWLSQQFPIGEFNSRAGQEFRLVEMVLQGKFGKRDFSCYCCFMRVGVTRSWSEEKV